MAQLRLFAFIAVTVLAAAPAGALVSGGGSPRTDCYATFEGVAGSNGSNEVVCVDGDPTCDFDGMCNGVCHFDVTVCARQDGGAECDAPTIVRLKSPGNKLALPEVPAADPTCGPTNKVAVDAGRHRTFRVMAMADEQPRRDKDRLKLTCKRRPDGEACPSATGCETVVPKSGIIGTYKALSLVGENLCTTFAPRNAFQQCTSEADCGGDATTSFCLTTPWLTIGGITTPMPIGASTTFTVSGVDPAPRCEHQVCLSCGDVVTPCPTTPGNPAAGCCSAPDFVVGAFRIPSLGICSRVDQTACGTGVINTSNPQTGDNEVYKFGDTTDPGTDCTYGTADDPAAGACTTEPGGQGSDTAGKITRVVGDGRPDPDGVQSRFRVPVRITTWVDGNDCTPDATYDAGEALLAQIDLILEPSTSGAGAEFVDASGDGCAMAGLGFTGPGPAAFGPPAAKPNPYDGGTATPATVGVAMTGAAPLFDVGFATINTNTSSDVLPFKRCACAEPASGSCQE